MSSYCPGCGSPVGSSDAYCVRCGEQLPERATSVGADTTQGRPSRRPLAARIDQLRGDGWTVADDEGDRVVLVDRGVGSVPAHLILFFLTGGTGNVLYGAYRWTLGAPRRELRTDGTDRRLGGTGRRVGQLLAGVAAGVVLFVGAVVAVASLLAGQPAGLLALLAAIGVVAALWWRAGDSPDWHPSRFGRERTVDVETAAGPAEPCASCGGPVQAGERRTYADRTYLAGLPVRTHDSGVNVYCRGCLAAPGSGDDRSLDREFEELRAER